MDTKSFSHFRNRGFNKFFGGLAQASQLGKDEAGDMAGPNVPEHPLSLRETKDRFATDHLDTVNFLHLPALGLGTKTGAPFMVLQAVPYGLILGGYSDSDANGLWCAIFN